MPMPTKRTPEVVAEILRRLSGGEPLAAICRSEDRFPSPTVWGQWVAADENLAFAYARAREEGFDAIACDALDILDTEPEMATGADGSSRRDAAFVAWQKNRFEGRLKLLAKWDPKRYGELIKHGNADGSNIDLAASLSEARERVQRGE